MVEGLRPVLTVRPRLERPWARVGATSWARIIVTLDLSPLPPTSRDARNGDSAQAALQVGSEEKR